MICPQCLVSKDLNVKVPLNFTNEIEAFSKYRKRLPNVINARLLWRICRGIWAIQKSGNILNWISNKVYYNLYWKRESLWGQTEKPLIFKTEKLTQCPSVPLGFRGCSERFCNKRVWRRFMWIVQTSHDQEGLVSGKRSSRWCFHWISV